MRGNGKVAPAPVSEPAALADGACSLAAETETAASAATRAARRIAPLLIIRLSPLSESEIVGGSLAPQRLAVG
jgi:hypothetical protein